MSDYGAFKDIVANAGTIMAMAAAIGLAWRGRSKWEPAEDDVPKAPQKVAGLLSALAITAIWTAYQDVGHIHTLIGLALGLGLGALASLCVYAFLVSTLTYVQLTAGGPKKVKERNIIGGFVFTAKSRAVIEKQRAKGLAPPTTADLFKAAAYNPDSVWERWSRSLAKVLCIVSYVGLIVTGTVALAAAAILVDLRLARPQQAIADQFVRYSWALAEGRSLLYAPLV